jgi:hypothetical protein
MDVPIRLDSSGALLIGESPAAPAGVGIVLLRGAEAFIDPTAPESPTHLAVHDVDEAADVVAQLHGNAAARAAARVAAGGPTETVASESTADTAAVIELGLLRWLDTTSPDRLSAGLLDLQRGVAAATAGDLLAEAEAEAAERGSIRWAGLAVDVARRLRDRRAAAPSGLAALLGRAVPALFEVLPMNHPRYDDLLHEEEVARALTALGEGVRLDWSELELLPGVGERAVSAAAHLGEDDVGSFASVDWHQVPRGLLDTAEGTVSWTLRAGAQPHVTVAARAAPRARRDAGLAFRLYGGVWPVPIAFGPMALSADGTAFTGDAPVVGTPEEPLTMDICAAQDARPPRLGVDAVNARANRWAVRAVTALRLAGPAPDVDPAVRGALEEALRLFGTVGARHSLPDRRVLALRRQARSAAVLRAVLTRSGALAEADELAEDFGEVSDVIGPADVTPPDLGAPGWAALAAEQAVAADESWGLT